MFDPYHDWLGIVETQRPLNLYQLIGVNPAEKDLKVIENAINARLVRLNNFVASE